MSPRFLETIVLIPCHSLEDFPVDLGDPEAESLLNAFAVAWHPWLLQATQSVPTWHRSDEPPILVDNRLFIVPTAANDWLPHGWAEDARRQGAAVIGSVQERADYISQINELFPEHSFPDATADAVNDFYALGTAVLQLELLTRHMRHFGSLDDSLLLRRSKAAVEAISSGDLETMQVHLAAAFESLQEARERFHPIDCYFLDLCLFLPGMASDLSTMLEKQTGINLLVRGDDLESLAESAPETVTQLREAVAGGKVELLGGERGETPSPLLPLGTLLREFVAGRDTYLRHLGTVPRVWGRRRFGLHSLLPQILKRFGFDGALHVLLDDGIYPDEEHSRIRWEGCDGTVIDALSRIPLAAEGAVSYLRFAQRMAESMDHDTAAALVLARWPSVKSVFHQDFRRIASYAPVFGKFIGFREFFDETDANGRLSNFQAAEYITPYLWQSAARREPFPLTRYRRMSRRWAKYEAASVVEHLTQFVRHGAVDDASAATTADLLIANAEPTTDDPTADADVRGQLDGYVNDAMQAFAELVTAGSKERRGELLFNPLSFSRRVGVRLTDFASAPAGSAVRAAQADGNAWLAVVDLPANGYVWLDADGGGTPTPPGRQPLAENLLLRNEFFEVVLNESTGGIARIRPHERRANYLSTQLAYRFPRERRYTDDDGAEESTHYSLMTLSGSEVVSRGPVLGCVRTSGVLIDPADGSEVAGFRQEIRVWRSRPIIEIDVDIDPHQLPEMDPWAGYYAMRWAWNDPLAARTRSVLHGAHAYRGDRFESPDYIEIAGDTERTTIFTDGLPFHRQSGGRMIDTLMITANESARHFRFVIGIDQLYPEQFARDQVSPPLRVVTGRSPTNDAFTGWFFHLDARNVQLLSVLTGQELPPPSGHDADPSASAPPHVPATAAVTLRLQETEGRTSQVRLSSFRSPARAAQVDFTGKQISRLDIEDETVVIEVTAYEIVDVVLEFV